MFAQKLARHRMGSVFFGGTEAGEGAANQRSESKSLKRCHSHRINSSPIEPAEPLWPPSPSAEAVSCLVNLAQLDRVLI
jgi:hypothetical protein